MSIEYRRRTEFIWIMRKRRRKNPRKMSSINHHQRTEEGIEKYTLITMTPWVMISGSTIINSISNCILILTKKNFRYVEFYQISIIWPKLNLTLEVSKYLKRKGLIENVIQFLCIWCLWIWEEICLRMYAAGIIIKLEYTSQVPNCFLQLY